MNEYKVVQQCTSCEVEEHKINEFARDGWELVCVGYGFEKGPGHPTTRLYFKRPLD
jgi:hypothetical protein